MTTQLLTRNIFNLPPAEDILPAKRPGYLTQTIGEFFGLEISPDLTAWQTLQVMGDIVREGCNHPTVRALAQDLASDQNAGNAALAIYKWVSRHMPFREDPWIVFNGKLKKTERIMKPWYALQKIDADGSVYGDCDDMATLITSLLKSLNFRTGFVAVATGNEGNRLDHVFSFCQIGRVCVTCDPASMKKDWTGHRLWKVEV